MIFRSRAFDKEKDAHLLRAWVVNRRLPNADVNLEFMPPTGVVVEVDNIPVAIGFMIKCDNGMCINSDLISNPAIDKKARQEAVDFLRESLYTLAKAAGYKLVTVFTRIPKLQARLEKEKGYFKIDQGLTQLGRFLWQ